MVKASALGKQSDFVNAVLPIIKGNAIIKVDTHDIKFQYPDWVTESNIYTTYGVFIDYLIRHRIMSETGIPISDARAEYVTNILEDEGSLSQAIYDRYCNNPSTLDIWNTCLLHHVFFGEGYKLELYHNYRLDLGDYIRPDMLRAVLNQVDRMIKNKTIVESNPMLGSPELGIAADADLILDDEIVDFKVSKGDIGSKHKDFILLIVYAALYDRPIHLLTIYNPLLSVEYSMTITDDLVQQVKDILQYGSTRQHIYSSYRPLTEEIPTKVKNPETGRQIDIGGPTYKKLIAKGYEYDDVGNFLYK